MILGKTDCYVSSILYSNAFRLKVAFILKIQTIKSLLYYRGITQNRATSGAVHLRGIASGQHGFEETSQRFGNIVSDFTWPGIELKLFSIGINVFDLYGNRPVSLIYKNPKRLCT